MNVIAQLRALGMALAAGAAARGLYAFQVTGREPEGWWCLLAALLLGVAAQAGLDYPAPPPAPPPAAASRARRALGAVLALIGAACWGLATWRLYQGWVANFDFAWVGWIGAVILLGVGLDLAWGTWTRPAERRWSGGVPVAMVGLLAVAAAYRLGNIADFPGEAAATQIEDFQVGNFGQAYLNGYRLRWEYLSSTWLAALGIWLGGPSQLAMRVPFAVVSALKVLPVFVWLRLSVGTAGALVGTALLACSMWDVVLSRIPNNHNALVVSVVFALLAGPVRRGRPSAYVLLGFFGGYVLHEYIAYRPLAALAVAGAVVWSLRDRAAPWVLRAARPLLTVAILLTMVAPLFLVRIAGAQRIDYFDGWNRARGIADYYDPNATWGEWLELRFYRARNAAELFTVRGDRSPVRNLNELPLVDPVTCALLVLGIAGVAAHPLRPVFALTLIGFAVTVAGTLILTGNWDVARVGGAVPYVYVLAGFGAAGLSAAWISAWGRAGGTLSALLLAAAVAAGGAWGTSHLIELWNHPKVLRAHRNNLAYLTIWIGKNTRPGERVLGIAPTYENALEGHDGSWLRGGPVEGYVTNDLETALRQWEQRPGPTLLFAMAGRSTPAVARYLTALLPGVELQFDRDPLDLGADIASAHLPAAPPEVVRRLDEMRCRGIRGDYALIGAAEGEVLFKQTSIVPFVSKSTWPQKMMHALEASRVPVTRIRIDYATTFQVTQPGEYRFLVGVYAGQGTLRIDGETRDGSAEKPVQLGAGAHTLELAADFAPLGAEAYIELLWSGPDTGNRQELVPFYLISPPDPSCGPA